MRRSKALFLAAISLLSVVSALKPSQLVKCTRGKSLCTNDCACKPMGGTLGDSCIHSNTLFTAQRDCLVCTANENCTKTRDTCDTEHSVCTNCRTAALVAAIKDCGVTNSPGVCVSTAWLHANGLEHGILRASAHARVLCLPAKWGKNLPCGTPGHLLRRASDGVLVSYREICSKPNTECAEAYMAVSQLRHDVDWSRYTHGALRLTSLSAHPDSSWRFVAHVTDALNRIGLGRLCNAIATADLYYNYIALPASRPMLKARASLDRSHFLHYIR